MENKDKLFPYNGVNEDEWEIITYELVKQHPLSVESMKDVVFRAWDIIMNASIGEYSIGKELTLSPQALGTLLHEIIPLELKRDFNKDNEVWKKDTSKHEKDLVYVPDDFFSIEIKTSSQSGIYGNRSYAQPQTENSKLKDGYLFINKF